MPKLDIGYTGEEKDMQRTPSGGVLVNKSGWLLYNYDHRLRTDQLYAFITTVVGMNAAWAKDESSSQHY